MIVDLMKLHVREVDKLIVWCIANDIDKQRAMELRMQWYADPKHWTDIDWKLDIPEEHLMWWMLSRPEEYREP